MVSTYTPAINILNSFFMENWLKIQPFETKGFISTICKQLFFSLRGKSLSQLCNIIKCSLRSNPDLKSI